jgi:hypothetical protein
MRQMADGETGYQKSHTSLGVDLEKIAAASGVERCRTIAGEPDLAEGARLLRDGNSTAFVVLRVRPDDPPAYKRNLDPAASASAGRCAGRGEPKSAGSPGPMAWRNPAPLNRPGFRLSGGASRLTDRWRRC